MSLPVDEWYFIFMNSGKLEYLFENLYLGDSDCFLDVSYPFYGDLS
jgi:hypothetical protein